MQKNHQAPHKGIVKINQALLLPKKLQGSFNPPV